MAGALAVEQIAGIDSIQKKRVAGVALAIGPDWLIAQAGVRAGAIWQFRIHTGRENGQPRETSGR